MKKAIIAILAAVLLLTTVACGGGTGAQADEDTFIAYNVAADYAVVTQTQTPNVQTGELIRLNFPAETKEPELGSTCLYRIQTESTADKGQQIYVIEEIKEEKTAKVAFATVGQMVDQLSDTAYLIDVRTAQEYTQSHIPGAYNLPLDDLTNTITTVVSQKDGIVILYCASGNRSAQGAKALEAAGYEVILDAGGIRSYAGTVISGSERGELPGREEFGAQNKVKPTTLSLSTTCYFLQIYIGSES